MGVRSVGVCGLWGCAVCGSVPLARDNEPEEMGELTSNYVSGGVGVAVAVV